MHTFNRHTEYLGTNQSNYNTTVAHSLPPPHQTEITPCHRPEKEIVEAKNFNQIFKKCGNGIDCNMAVIMPVMQNNSAATTTLCSIQNFYIC